MKKPAPRREDNKKLMITVEQVTVRKRETEWVIIVTPRIQRLIERIGVYYEKSTHEALSDIIKEAIEAKERHVFFAKVDERIDAALERIDSIGEEE